MGKIKCTAHGRRVWVLEGGKVVHRTGDCGACDTDRLTYQGRRFPVPATVGEFHAGLRGVEK